MWKRILLIFLSTRLQTAAALSTLLHLAYLAPYEGPWSGGIAMEPAVLMAFEAVNADPHTLPGESKSQRYGGAWQRRVGVWGNTCRGTLQ